MQRPTPTGRLALKRKAEGDPNDSEVENTVMNSLAELRHENNDPDDEIDLLTCQQRDQYVASVHETGTDRPVCEEPKTPFPHDECGRAYIDDTSGKLLKTTLLSRRRGQRRLRSFVSWVSRLVVQGYRRQADWSFFTATPPLEALRSLLICATIEELPKEGGQRVAWSELVVLMLIDVRRTHFYSAARRKVFVELPSEACTDKSKVGLVPGARSMKGCRDAGVNWNSRSANS